RIQWTANESRGERPSGPGNLLGEVLRLGELACDTLDALLDLLRCRQAEYRTSQPWHILQTATDDIASTGRRLAAKALVK
ncbi:hypothetical protein, partial [Klebsiella pneumoniae]|uniref:hypothetical protein n=1 Tax=Klebsiella pneumoniae TaxID=573 RepID=UPI00132FBD8F